MDNNKKVQEHALYEDGAARQTFLVNARIRRAQAEAPQVVEQLKLQQALSPIARSPNQKKKRSKASKKKKSTPPSPSPARSPGSRDKVIGSKEVVQRLLRKKKSTSTTEESEEELSEKKTAGWRKFVDQCVCTESSITHNTYFLTNLLNLTPSTKSYEAFSRNRLKNRSPDVFCFDRTRFHLTSEPNDYIHANYIRFEKLPKKVYIATQHPMESTMTDFWAMITDSKADVIISLTNATSADYPVYYPNKQETFRTFGQYFVYCKRAKPQKSKYGLVAYTFELVVAETTRTVRLFHYRYWNKNQVPASTKVVLNIVKILGQRKSAAPVVIQCETGVNQTAEVVLVDAMCSGMVGGVEQQIDHLFRQLRYQRASSMTHRLHFLHAITCILEFIKTRFKMTPELVAQIESVTTSISKDFDRNTSLEPYDQHVTEGGATIEEV